MNRFSTLLVVGALLLFANTAAGQRASELSADLPDHRVLRVLRVQQKVESLFAKGQYDRALFIYRNELAPIGDKYAQYMVGYMHQTGLGANRDDIIASAWYRLSAERGTPEFVQVREDIMASLNERDTARSNALYRELRGRYSDLAVLMEAIIRDQKVLSERTGSRAGGFSGAPVTIIDPRDGQYRTGEDYYGEIQRLMQARIRLVVELGDFYDLVGDDPSQVSIERLEELVMQRVQSVDD